MIIGIGIDLCDASRIRDMPGRERFLTRFFTPEERAYFDGRGVACDDSVAACYAAKEAFLKALGTGISEAALHEVSVLHADSGAPSLMISGTALRIANERGVKAMHLSLTHEGGMAAAVVVLEG
ncbi:MAG: holo-ACP synthase [Clostridiales bacterium]|nr:holo-ACP synthase [Clostridiales bacterium]